MRAPAACVHDLGVYHLHDMSGWGAAPMMILWTAAFIGAMVLLAWIVRQWPQRGPGAGGGSARDVLDQRLATGEIDIDAYRRLREAMERPTPAT